RADAADRIFPLHARGPRPAGAFRRSLEPQNELDILFLGRPRDPPEQSWVGPLNVGRAEGSDLSSNSRAGCPRIGICLPAGRGASRSGGRDFPRRPGFLRYSALYARAAVTK